MARERVDSFTEAKELSGEHKRVKHGKIGPDIHAGPLSVHGASGQNMDGISADFEQLTALNATLKSLRDQLEGHMTAAGRLAEPLTDGTSPVTGPMRKAFLQRADVNEGVQGALAQYMNELDAVQTAINNTLSTYRGVDGDAVARFNLVGNEEESV
jgi:hypothetical protein